MTRDYDLVIVGGGVTGTALLYTVAEFTDIGEVALVEKEATLGAVNSHHRNNSQTLHFGDIETNYTLAKAKSVKEGAEMVAGYLEATDEEREIHSKRSKMALAVGDREAEELRRRYHDEGFGDCFPKLDVIGREEIGELEPAVVEGRDADETLLALHTPDGYTVDYGALAQSFAERVESEVDLFRGTSVTSVDETDDGFRVRTESGTLAADAVVVAAGSHSLQLAKRMGYGESLSLLPVAGSFYLADEPYLNGKVYTLQMKKLPFAAIHGDSEVHDADITRFGPTAKVVPTLERGNLSTVGDFLDVFGLGVDSLASYAAVLLDRVRLPYVLKNLVYDVPAIGKRAFLPHVRKIVPTAGLNNIRRARGYGGVRPQIIDTDERQLDMGEAKIEGAGIIFNVTPSPGASNCLKTAMRDVRTVTDHLDAEFDEAAFREATIANFTREPTTEPSAAE